MVKLFANVNQIFTADEIFKNYVVNIFPLTIN